MDLINLTSSVAENGGFTGKIGKDSGQPVRLCYQCGKCTAGCPVAFAMDYPVHRVIRMVQIGLKDEVLKSNSIWLCTGCETCSARCPRKVNIAGVMESLRIEAARLGIAPAGKGREVSLFYSSVLDTVRKYGRLYEFGAMFNYNLKSLQPLRDVDTALSMLRHGKLSFFPSRVKGTGDIKRIFAAVQQEEDEKQ